MQPYLSIIVPAYNEEQNINKGVIEGLVEYLNSQTFTWEILIVNDGSTDQTDKLIKKISKDNNKIIYIQNPHMGKAATIMTGAARANGKYFVYTDMDQATPISEIHKLLHQLNQGIDIVIGSRQNRKGAPLFRQILAYGNVIMRTLILRLPYKDTQCGFKAFSSSSAKKIFLIMQKFHPLKVIDGPAVNAGFDMEILFLARKLKYRVVEVPVQWRHQETKRVSFIRDAFASMKELMLIRYRAITNAYDLTDDNK